MENADLQRLASKAEQLCARSEHCEQQVREKLILWGASPQEAENIVKALKNARFIDDSRFAHAYVNDKLRYQKWGRIKIRQYLRHLGISNETIEECLAEIDEDEYRDILLSLLRAKERTTKASSPYELRGKLARFAASRGFEASLVFPLLGAEDWE